MEECDELNRTFVESSTKPKTKSKKVLCPRFSGARTLKMVGGLLFLCGGRWFLEPTRNPRFTALCPPCPALPLKCPPQICFLPGLESGRPLASQVLRLICMEPDLPHLQGWGT